MNHDASLLGYSKCLIDRPKRISTHVFQNLVADHKVEMVILEGKIQHIVFWIVGICELPMREKPLCQCPGAADRQSSPSSLMDGLPSE